MNVLTSLPAASAHSHHTVTLLARYPTAAPRASADQVSDGINIFLHARRSRQASGPGIAARVQQWRYRLRATADRPPMLSITWA
jgi:hypothetical protein